MKCDLFNFKSIDGKDINVYHWLPEDRTRPRAIIQVIHGMGEHAGRYQEFASFLTGRGFEVFANDHRAHGKTAAGPQEYGHIADRAGWDLILQDIKRLNQIIVDQHPGIRILFFGHSMGSFLARDLAIQEPSLMSGLILSGTSTSPGLAGYFGILAARILIQKNGPGAKSPLHRNLTFGRYNNYFEPNRTTSDWISRDTKEVDIMLADPYCYTLFSAAFYLELIRALLRINSRESLNKMSHDLPIFLISGSHDPLGNFKKGVLKVYYDFKKAGMENTSIKLYHAARHELIHELNKKEVFKDIGDWIDKNI